MKPTQSNSNTTTLIRVPKVLVVENDEDTLELLKFALTRIGVTGIHQAKDGTEALTLLRKDLFSLILCDWNMPKMSGLELLRSKKTLAKGSRTPFVFITAEGSKEKVIEACKEGASDYIVKPWNLEILTAKVKKYIDI